MQTNKQINIFKCTYMKIYINTYSQIYISPHMFGRQDMCVDG